MNKSSFENELINKIQFKASSKVSADMVLFKAFKFFDLYNNGFLVKKDFFKAIAKCGVIVDTYVELLLYKRILMRSIVIMILMKMEKLIIRFLLIRFFFLKSHLLFQKKSAK